MKNDVVNSLKDLPKLLDKAPETKRGGSSEPADNMVEIVRMLREIHAAVCGEEEQEAKAAGKKRNVIPGHVMRLMVDDRPYSPLEIHQKLLAEGHQFATQSIASAMTKLGKDSKITRLQRSLFQRLPQPKEGE